MNPIESGTMFSAQARTSIPLVKTDVNRTIKRNPTGKAAEQCGTRAKSGEGGGEPRGVRKGSGKPKNTD